MTTTLAQDTRIARPDADIELMSPSLNRLVADLGTTVTVNPLYRDRAGAVLYEALVDGDTAELAAILQASRGRRGPVLDLGCGGGRVTLPFLGRGHDVTALDCEPAMLEELRRRSSALPARLRDRLSMVCADMTALDLDGLRFDVIVLATTTVNLLTRAQRRNAFAAIAEHLSDDGIFLVTTLELPAEPPGAVGESTQVLAVTVDATPHVVTMVETVGAARGRREVALLDQGAVGGPARPAVYVNQPYLVSGAELVEDLAAGGLGVLDRVIMPFGASTRAVTMFECGVLR